ncbi:MAG: NlpC/P60 family protein [Coprobacillaceae bacterium]
MKDQYNSKEITRATRGVSKTSEKVFQGVEVGVKLLNSKIKTVTDGVDYDIRDKSESNDDADKSGVIRTSKEKGDTLHSSKSTVQTTKTNVQPAKGKGEAQVAKTSVNPSAEKATNPTNTAANATIQKKASIKKGKTTKTEKIMKGAIVTSKAAKVASKTVNKVARTSSILSQVSKGEGDKAVKDIAKRTGSKATRKVGKRVAKKVNKIFIKLVKTLGMKIVGAAGVTILSVGAIVPCVCAIALFVTVFGGGSSQSTIDKYGDYIISINREYKDSVDLVRSETPDITINSYDGSYGRIDWRAVLAVMQGIKSDLDYDADEQRLLSLLKEANLYEKQERVEGENIVLNITNERLPAYKNYVNSLFETEPELMKNLINKTQTSLTTEQEEFIDGLYTSQDLMTLFSPEVQQYGTFLDDDENSLSGVVVNGDSETGNKIAQLALTKTGCRYWWGAPGGQFQDGQVLSDPNAAYFDCSGLVAWAYIQAGVNIGRTTASGYSKTGQKIEYSELQAGDVITITYNNGASVAHIGIYIGGGMMVHASGDGESTRGQYMDQCVMVSPITEGSYWYKRIYNCRRMY